MLEGLWGGLIVAVVNFLMVFLILGSLAGVLVGLKKFVQLWEKKGPETVAEPSVPPVEEPAPSQENQIKAHIAAILAAIQEFTSLPPGSFRIDTIEPIEEIPVSMPHIAAIAAAIHEFTSMPQGSFRIVGIKHVGTANAWKMAGRFELIGLDID